jgi:hypothetical protein
MSETDEAAIQLRTASHSPQITRCEDLELLVECLLDEQTEKSYRRRILRMQWVDNAKDATKPVLATILHQKKHSRKDGWMDSFFHFDLAKLRAGEEIRLSFSAAETWRLYQALRQAYASGRPREEACGELDDGQPFHPDEGEVDDDRALTESLVYSEPPPPQMAETHLSLVRSWRSSTATRSGS